MRFAAFASQNAKAVITLVALLCALGGWFATRLPVAIFPQLTVPRIAISADAGDIPVQTTLAQLTRPLEATVSTVPGVVKVGSTTTRGSDSLDVTFADGTDMALALQRVNSQIAEVRGALPTGANVTAAVLNPSIFPIMGYSLTSDSTGGQSQSLAQLRQLAMYTIRPRLARLPGVAQIRVTGGDTPEYVVAVHPEALNARGLTLQDVQDALAKANGVTSVGQYDRAYQRYEVLVSGLLNGPDDIRQVAITTHNRTPILIGDVADVRSGVALRTVLATGDGRPGVILNVIKQPDANTIQVAQEVHTGLDDLKSALPAGVRLSRFYDQSDIVQQSESSVVESIVIGGVLALIVLVLFLGNLRVAGVVLIQLPLTLLITFSLMRALGQTLNIMTLGALAIAMGMVIDDGIVAVENIYHELEQGKSRRDAIAAGMQSIAPALIGSSLTTMVVFLPLTFLGGVTGQFFAPLAIVMIATLGVSLLLALIFTPIVANILLPRKLAAHAGTGLADPHATAPKPRGVLDLIFGFFPRMFDYVAAGFAKLLLACIRFKWLVLLLSVGALVGGYVVYGKLQTGFFPEFDEGAFVIDYRLPPGTSLAETDRVTSEVEKMLGETPEVAAWSRLTGARSGSGLELTEQNQGDILVLLKTQRTRGTDDITSDLRTAIAAKHPGFDLDMAQILQDGIGDIAGTPSPIEVKIYGSDTTTLVQTAHAAGKIVTATPGVVDENDGVVESGPEVTLRVDPARASQAGLTTDQIAASASAALQGTVATTIQQGENAIPVRVQAAQTVRASSGGTIGDQTQALPDLMIAAPGNATANPSVATDTSGTATSFTSGTAGGVLSVPLRSVASITTQPGSPQITRENQQQMDSVTARLEGRDLGSGVRDVEARLKQQLKLPAGYRFELGGLYASQQQSFAQLASVLLMAVLLVSTMLLIQLRSFRQSFALLIAAILSLVGVLFSLYVTATPLNISSFTGAIMVVGIITEDGIVFFDVVNHLRKLHPELNVTEAVMEARRLRLRPILMTILAAILALLPLALGIGAGAAMQKPLAIAVIGGLIASTVFTLLVAPVVYVTIENATEGKHPATSPSNTQTQESSE